MGHKPCYGEYVDCKSEFMNGHPVIRLVVAHYASAEDGNRKGDRSPLHVTYFSNIESNKSTQRVYLYL